MTTHAIQYRAMLRGAMRQFVPPPDTDTEDAFRDFLDAAYRDGVHQFTERQAEADASGDLGVLLPAIGLLTYGRLDVVPNILRHSQVPSHARAFLALLRTMLPWPEGMDPIGERDAALQWLQAHRAQLRFDAESGSFTLEKPAS